MAFGMLECKDGESPPGTVLITAVILSQQSFVESSSDASSSSAKGHHQRRGIVLVPQPSDSPNDPLNDFILLIISLLSAIVGAYGPMLGPGFVEISAELDVSVNEISQATSYLVLAIGIALLFSNPLAKCYGKRPVYLVSGLLLFASSIGAALTHDYNSFLACRLVGGLGMGPFEVLVQCTIGDLYFVHERASRIAFWNLFLVSGISAGPIVSAYIIQYAGYRWTFGVCAIFYGVLTIALFFLAPETAYIRVVSPPHSSNEASSMEQQDTYAVSGKDAPQAGSERLHDIEKEPEGQHDPPETSHSPRITQRKDSYWRSLRVYTGRYSNASLVKVISRPFILFLYPGILWAFLTWGTTITFTIAFSYVNGVIFNESPYNFTTSQIGLINISPLVLSVVSEIISGPLCDRICLYLTKRNNGYYEPEFRLVLMLVGFVLGVAGFYGFGATVHYKTHWTGPVITYGLVNASLAFCSTCVFGYIIDAYTALGEEAFVAVNSRNFLSFGILYVINEWLAQDGTLKVFVVLGSLFIFTSLLTIPIWVFGKRFRARIDKIVWLKNYMRDS
ncbi:major facilitator superfamily domain-containing protein [Aspergillus pseudonomiae]|uniref:Major facilitator superfamily domain-containing protein n=1 Tax=Aspergillus pseudonomiae TaxID=1506151 RepID=A0A5N7D0W0_9EURO|nr:major facilitator superfamily domain-containing protein [Aspergillus pseudonomiae]KAE8399513.1 major facilitator superfamily domain-containing protein [Aspergillus pseudonomiae]